MPPDPRAGEFWFWLTNRASDRWKHNQKIEHNEAIDSPLRLLAEQISGHAIRPRLSQPKVIEQAEIEPSTISPQQPKRVTSVTTAEPASRAALVTRVDDDCPRTPRIHTISEDYEDDDDEK